MIVRLLPEQIPAHWDTIKFAALSVNTFVGEKQTQEFCTNLLSNLMCDKSQVWFCVAEDQVKVVIITRIFKGIGDEGHLLLDVVYGYKPSTMDEKKELYGLMTDFARNIGCVTVTCYTANPMAANAARHMGLEKTHDMFSVRV